MTYVQLRSKSATCDHLNPNLFTSLSVITPSLLTSNLENESEKKKKKIANACSQILPVNGWSLKLCARSIKSVDTDPTAFPGSYFRLCLFEFWWSGGGGGLEETRLEIKKRCSHNFQSDR